jgi:hypothetical protein
MVSWESGLCSQEWEPPALLVFCGTASTDGTLGVVRAAFVSHVCLSNRACKRGVIPSRTGMPRIVLEAVYVQTLNADPGSGTMVHVGLDDEPVFLWECPRLFSTGVALTSRTYGDRHT